MNPIEISEQSVPTLDPTLNLLIERFGMKGFRIGQREIISDLLAAKDVLAILPTGGGKSLCYQLPAVYMQKLAIIVSPLIALMTDQVANLRKIGIPAGCIHSNMTFEQKRQIFAEMKQTPGYILYVSPERIQKEGFQSWIKTQAVGLFAIDEAHCISKWGHDFREDYNRVCLLKNLRPDVPMIALTASATPLVRDDIARQLNLKSPAMHVHGFYRSNLYYQIEECENDEAKNEYLERALNQRAKGRVIIYCGTRKTTESLAKKFHKKFSGVAYYHAGMQSASRTEIQKSYRDGNIRILFATNAFGMGVDQPDVRLVIHYNMPADIDSLYQEMGRAGRDGNYSTCLLLYSGKDKGLQSYFITSSEANEEMKRLRWRNLDALVKYAAGSECRHAEVLTYFRDSKRIKKCGHCDICDPKSKEALLLTSDHINVATYPQENINFVRNKSKRRTRSTTRENRVELDSSQKLIHESLRNWRKSTAEKYDIPTFMVLSDRALKLIAKNNPNSIANLSLLPEVGEHKAKVFGPEIFTFCQ